MTTTEAQKKATLLSVILLTGFIAGTLDGLAAVIHYVVTTGKNPILVFEFIASGVFGRDAFSGTGEGMAIWGLIFHFLIALTWTLIFFLVYPKISLLRENRITTGMGYGAFIWMVMNLIILPFSNAPAIRFDIIQAIIGATILTVSVGLPISLMSHKYYSGK